MNIGSTNGNENYGVPDDENPELTEEEFAGARRWRPGDPFGVPPSPVETLRAAARDLRRQADAFDREAERLEKAAENSPPHAAE